MLHEFLSKLHNLDALITWAGYIGLTIIVFCETGLLAGFFLPGDSLLVTAGFVASQGKLDIVYLNLLLCVAAIVGDSVGYAIGFHLGPRVFKKEDSFFFKKEYLEKTKVFFAKHGGKSIIMARFVPIVRTFTPTVAGVGKMEYKKFLFFNIFGGIFWVLSMTSIGYFLGRLIPGIDKQIDKVIIVVIFVSFLPILFEWVKSKKKA